MHIGTAGCGTHKVTVHPTASIHQRGTLLRLRYCGALCAGAPPAMLWRARVPVTRSEATMERWMGIMGAARSTRRSRRSGPAEDWAQAGGGPGAGGPGADPGRRLSGVLAEHSLIG